MEDERTMIIQHYFHLGYENEVIRQFLADYHGIKMSLSTLKRRLWDFGFKRSGNDINVDWLREIIRNEIRASGAVDCKWVVQRSQIDEMEQHLNVESNESEADIYQEYFHFVMNHQGLQLPSSMQEAFDLFQGQH